MTDENLSETIKNMSLLVSDENYRTAGSDIYYDPKTLMLVRHYWDYTESETYNLYTVISCNQFCTIVFESGDELHNINFAKALQLYLQKFIQQFQY